MNTINSNKRSKQDFLSLREIIVGGYGENLTKRLKDNKKLKKVMKIIKNGQYNKRKQKDHKHISKL